MIMNFKYFNSKTAIFASALLFVMPLLASPQIQNTLSQTIAINDTSTAIPKAADFTLTDTAGNVVRVSDFKGKWVFADIWYSGCGGCITANKGIRFVHDSLANNDIVFLSISIDKSREKWISSITAGAPKTELNPWAGLYVPAKGTITLYTSGAGYDNDFRRYYVPKNRYPQLLLLDKDGKLIEEIPPRPDTEPQKLIDYLRRYMNNKN
jgi:cytochrome oxidase Cu insertion factor (SCO1/SenC/PrrC family)